jgi:hypothetical protein
VLIITKATEPKNVLFIVNMNRSLPVDIAFLLGADPIERAVNLT